VSLTLNHTAVPSPSLSVDGNPPQLAALELTEAQLTALLPVLRSALADRRTQLRHCTPFSPLKNQLRGQVSSLQQLVQNPERVTPEQAGLVVEVLATRLSRLRDQLRRCDTPDFKTMLALEAAELAAIRVTLVRYPAER
jgi:hypothetical protein